MPGEIATIVNADAGSSELSEHGPSPACAVPGTRHPSPCEGEMAARRAGAGSSIQDLQWERFPERALCLNDSLLSFASPSAPFPLWEQDKGQLRGGFSFAVAEASVD